MKNQYKNLGCLIVMGFIVGLCSVSFGQYSPEIDADEIRKMEEKWERMSPSQTDNAVEEVRRDFKIDEYLDEADKAKAQIEETYGAAVVDETVEKGLEDGSQETVQMALEGPKVPVDGPADVIPDHAPEPFPSEITELYVEQNKEINVDSSEHQVPVETLEPVETKPAAVSTAKTNLVQDDKPIENMTDVIHSVMREEYKHKRIDLDFDETNLNDIFVTLGETGQLNFVLDPALKGNTLEIHVKDVEFVEALMLIANTYNLDFKKVGQSLFVTTRDKLREENMVTRVIKLRNLKVSEAKPLISGLVQSVSLSEEINSLVVAGEPDNIKKVEEMLSKLDRPQPQVILEAKVIEINKDALKDIGVDWSDQLTLNYQESNRPVNLSNIEDAPGSFIEIFSLARSPIQFTTLIKMLESENKARVLSTPRVTTLNNKEAEIFVGDRIPYTVTTVSGGVATTDVRFEEPGIRLKITPSIIEEDFVVIKVQPEVSFIFTFRGPNNEFPQTKKREATAYVRVKNNQPFVLGGLLNQEDKKNFAKVPLLGDVPILGRAFKTEKHTAVDTELIITVIPTIVLGDK